MSGGFIHTGEAYGHKSSKMFSYRHGEHSPGNGSTLTATFFTEVGGDGSDPGDIPITRPLQIAD